MKKLFVLLLHFGYWLMYLLLISVMFAVANIQIKKAPSFFSVLFPLILLCVVPNLFSFYLSYLFLFPGFLYRKKFAGLLFFGILVCIISAVSGALASVFIFGFDQPIFTDTGEFASFFVSFFLIAAIHGAIALVIRGFITWYAEIKLKEELSEKNFEMELALIKSQINPHFLFNTINNIDVLITKDSAKASSYLNQLSGILRYMVYETENEKIPLAKELDYIENYLELQKIRTVNPDYVKHEVTGEANNLTIAPMILFPFIENAFKHTENKKNTSSIRIKVSIEKGKLAFECENSYQANADKKHDFGGLGNELIKKRLELLYPGKYSLETSDSGTVYEVKLIIDLVGA